jgi:cytochrome c556
MWRPFTYALILSLVSGVAVRAAGKVQTVEELDRAMKRIGPAQQAVSKAIQAMAYADAKKQLDVIEAELKDAQNFWVVKRREDATKFTAATLVKIESLRKLIDATTPDQMAVTSAYREVGVACAACHRVYRTTDDDNKFILKPGTVH